MKSYLPKAVLGALLILLGSFSLSAQDKSEKIILEITKEVNGEKKTFKGEYENEDQMRQDPSYQEFMGKNDNFTFDFNGFDSEQFNLDIQKLMDQHSFNFSFDTDEPNGFHFQMDSATFFDMQDLDDMASQFEQMQKHFKMLQLDDKQLQEHLQILKDRHEDIDMAKVEKLKITDVEGDEFGKKGTVKASERLELNELDYYPNPSTGKFKLRFKVPRQGELSVKVYDLSGKEVFTRYFDQFGGFYSEFIDLAGQDPGIYLLEIKLDKERLTRKIVID